MPERLLHLQLSSFSGTAVGFRMRLGKISTGRLANPFFVIPAQLGIQGFQSLAPDHRFCGEQ